MSVIVYIALGSNLDTPISHIQRACQELGALPQTRSLQCSRLYQSTPHGAADQPDYINAVVELETRLPSSELLSMLQSLEQAHGRVHTGERWGPRPLDLDILLYGDQQIDGPNLQIPHPYMVERAFVLYPLAELVTDLNIPGYGLLSDLLQTCPAGELEPLNEL
ncbi:MAG: 2-amino-4-hydroxy-6-hydroxymethyldihydropteridine diphosphokinase [Candidatus Polarisedimenticolaceae bacterium]|nr:2-amino-4-hydroxy-6-hydroxymethyldihydropteridine diphosphokinase [Candidatus Polarisedimenticolaceae bacterium]